MTCPIRSSRDAHAVVCGSRRTAVTLAVAAHPIAPHASGRPGQDTRSIVGVEEEEEEVKRVWEQEIAQ